MFGKGQIMNKKLLSSKLFFISLLIFLIPICVVIVFSYIKSGNIVLIYALSGFLIWLLICAYFFKKLLEKSFEGFTTDICDTIDNMLDNRLPAENIYYSEDLYNKIKFKLLRVNEILQEDRHLLGKEKMLLQSFISDTAHQIKTPMANLKMISETLLMNNLSENERLAFLQNSNSQLLKLEFVLDALIKSSRLETGMVTLRKTNYDSREIISDVITLALPLLTKKQQEIRLDCPENLSIYVDKKWLMESIFNILENAIKYTNEKTCIYIRIEKNEMYTMISIRDTGCAIKESDLSNIFNRFYRGENTSEIDGVGIGLYLAREIITLHHGYIRVHSAIDIGSTFEMHLLNQNR